MALIKCPECKKDISDTARKCPNCGVRIRTKIKKSNIILIISILLLCVCCLGGFFIYKNIQNEKRIAELKLQASVIEKDISSIINGEIIKYNEIIEIKKSYDNLDNDVKEYVSNGKELKNYKIKLTNDNFKDFFTIKVNLTDYYAQPKSGLLTIEYDNYCTQKSIIQPKATFKCNDVYVTLNYNYIPTSWRGGGLNNVRLEEDGSFEDTYQIYVFNSLLKVQKPVFYEKSCVVEEVSGYLTLE